MKKYYIILISCFWMFSCKEVKKQENQKDERSDHQLGIEHVSHPDLLHWLQYYQTTIDSSFSIDNFVFELETEIPKTEGSVLALFDDSFDKIYTDFLIYSPNQKKYIDIDSYQWSLDTNTNAPMFEADQEITLVDLESEKAWRIGFLGPSYVVENALWQNDSIVLLLQNSYDQVPSIQKVNVNTFSKSTYNYNDTLAKKSDYRIIRINKILNNE